MGKFVVENYFTYKTVNPGSLLVGSIVMFSYKSPNGVHDRQPLVYVTEKKSDRFFGINLHYDFNELNEAVTRVETKILPHLEKEYYKKYPENKKKLQETRQKFNKTLITEQEYHEMMKGFPQRDLEVFEVQSRNMEAMRCYLYQRVTACSKLVFKN